MIDAPRIGKRQARKQLGRASWKRVRHHVLVRDLWQCQFCGGEATMAAHVIPADRYTGSHDDPANLVASCVGCNNSQRGMTIEEWYEKAGKPLPGWWAARGNGGPPTTYPYHVHAYPNGGVMIAGDMSKPWPADAGCPPDCTLERK